MRLLLAASVAIGLAAAAAPGLIARHMQSGADAVPAPSAAPAARERSDEPPAPSRAGGARRVEIAAERDGHFYVEAEVNLRRVRLMVDTGASVVTLRRSDAAAIGIRPVPADFDRPVSTANGIAHAAEAALDSVRIEAIEVEGVRALILPDERLAVSLLGATFLNRLARYEVSGGTLLIEN